MDTDDCLIIEGDALAALPDLPSASVDAVVTDPPYNSGGQFKGDRSRAPSEKYQLSTGRDLYHEFTGDTRDQRSFGYWCCLWLGQCLRVAKDGAPICLFTDWRQLPTVTDVLQAAGWMWRGVAVWDKTEGTRPQMGRFRAQAEFVVWGSKGDMPPREDVGVLPGVFRHVVRSEDKHHIAGKMTRLMIDVVRICPPGGLVLDPFLGSGTTAVASRKTGRRCLGIEIDPRWAGVARRRLTMAETPLFATQD